MFMKLLKSALKKYNDIPLAAKATIWFIFCSVLQKCISMITMPIFTRIMSTEQYGQFSVYSSWLQIFTIITTLRLNYAVFNKGMSKYKDDRDGYTSTMQSITFILTGIVFCVYLLFREQINAITELPTFIMVAIFAELFVTPAIDFWTIRKRYEYIYKPVIARTLLMVFLNSALGIAAVLLSEEKGYARIMTCVFVNICFGACLFVYNCRKGKTLLKLEYVKFAIGFNLPLLLHYFSQYILDQFDRIMIQKMVGFSAAGIYSVAYSAGLVLKIVTQNVNSALVPWQYGKLEKNELAILDSTIINVYAFVGACAVVFSAFAPELMKILASEKYYEAVYVIPPVALSMYFVFLYTSFANVEFFYDLNKFTMFISMAGAAINIVLNYIGIQMFGYIAAAYTTLICYIIFTVAHFLYAEFSLRKKLHVDRIFNAKKITLLSLVILAMGILVAFLYERIVLRYTLIAVVMVICYWKKEKIIGLLLSIRKKR